MASEWLSPGVLLSATGLVAGGIAWLVAWSIRQDRRIEDRVTNAQLDGLRREVAAIEKHFSAASSEIGQLSSLSQTRDICNGYRTQQTHDISELQAKIDVLTERVKTVTASHEDSRALLRAVDELVRVTGELRAEVLSLKRGKA